MTAIAGLSREERERAYSPSSCIGGDYAPYLRAYAERSRAAMERFDARRDLAYGERATQRLDLFLPPPAALPPPLLVFIHGGYWQELSKAASSFAAPDCLEHGAAFAAIDYTLAPAATVQEMVLECRQALRWLHAQAEALGFDPARIVVAGSSAGAHLAAMACLRGWPGDADLPTGLPSGAVLVSGIYELAPLIGTSINEVLALTEADTAHISPLSQALEGVPPAIVCWGEVETAEFKRQSRTFAQAARARSVFEVPRRNHFDVILDLAAPGTPLGDATLRMLARG